MGQKGEEGGGAGERERKGRTESEGEKAYLVEVLWCSLSEHFADADFSLFPVEEEEL